MAKQRATIDQGLFKSTEGGAVEVPAVGKASSISVGLRASEIDLLNQVAERYQVSRNALLRLAARRFLEDVLNGRIDLETMIEAPPPPKRRLVLP
jgi:hypothetical protein